MMQLTSRRVDSYHLPERALSCRTPPSQSKIWFKGRTTSVTLFLVNTRGNSTQGRRPTMSCLEGEETISCPERPGNTVLPTTAAVTFSLLSFQKFLSPQRSSGQFYNLHSALWCFFSITRPETRKIKQKGFCRAFPNTYKQHNHPSHSELLAWNTVTFSELNQRAWWLQHIHLRFIYTALLYDFAHHKGYQNGSQDIHRPTPSTHKEKA